MNSKKAVAVACLVSFLSFGANFGVFVFGYDRLAVPFLPEEQRVANAEFIMSVILIAFALLAIIVGSAVYFAFGEYKRKRGQSPFLMSARTQTPNYCLKSERAPQASC